LAVQCRENCVEDCTTLLQDFVVPKAKHRVALLVKPASSNDVVLAFGVLGTVEFNDQSLFTTDEIGNIAAERDLA